MVRNCRAGAGADDKADAVTPAKAGVQATGSPFGCWMPAFAGMTAGRLGVRKVRYSLCVALLLSAAIGATAAGAKTQRLTDDETNDQTGGQADQSTRAGPKFGWPGPAMGWPTDGRPVAEKDLIGKKICWSDGKSDSFSADAYAAKWWVTEPGVIKIGEHYRQLLVLPAGGFYEHWYSGHWDGHWTAAR